MYGILIGIVVVLGVAALIGTIFAGLKVNKTIKEYEAEEGDKLEKQLQRSIEYEKSSLKKNVPLMATIYGVAFVVVVFILIIVLVLN